ncbi:hypothetical protein NKJ84_21005 [Mesorhizobium sp. M0048]
MLAVGDGVEHFRPGQRVAWVYAPGSYTDRAMVPADALVPIPDGIDDRTAASVMMKGLTCQPLRHRILSRPARRRRAGPCGGGRRRIAAHPDHQAERRARDRPRLVH